ncbi:hypothetical protein AB0C02_27875 [Micromonospora sp. NPDC048999]|uniref:hypothetical protein n=1 Tax=Micromonospora sp. NPDC048999 TaxID=3155391 RepID=UPI0033DBF3AF
MTFTQTSNGTVRRTMTYSDQAHLLRSIEHAVTYDRFAAPTSINMQPEHRYAIIQFAGDEVAAVREWAARVGATVVHGDCTYDRTTGEPWHEFGTRPGGKKGQLVGWTVDLWCRVNTPSPVEPEPESIALDPATGADLAAKMQAEVDAIEHRHAGGTVGGPGENSAACACSVTYAGFDTHAEAAKLLDEHIANPAAAEPQATIGDLLTVDDAAQLADDVTAGIAKANAPGCLACGHVRSWHIEDERGCRVDGIDGGCGCPFFAKPAGA